MQHVRYRYITKKQHIRARASVITGRRPCSYKNEGRVSFMKKKLRKRLVAGIVATMMMTTMFTGCGSSSETTTGAAKETEGTTAGAATEGTSGEKKVLKVGIECAYAPYNWTQEEETVANGDKAVKIKNAEGYAYGYDVKLAQMIADELGWDLEIYKSDWSAIFMGMADGTYDCIMSGFCYSEERDISYDFTSPYYCRTIVATVREDSPLASVTKLSEFEGKNPTICTQLGTNYVPYKDEVPSGVAATDYETSAECFMAVQNKSADMVILDITTTKSALASMTGLKMLTLDPSDDFVAPEGSTNDCCICFSEGSPLRDTVQGAMDKIGWTKEHRSDKFDPMMDEMLKLQPSSN